MSIFKKTVLKTVELPFKYVKNDLDIESGFISLSVTDTIDNRYTYISATFCLSKRSMYNKGDYDKMVEVLEKAKNIKAQVDLKYKGNKLKGFNIDTLSLSKSIDDERFEKLEYMGGYFIDHKID